MSGLTPSEDRLPSLSVVYWGGFSGTVRMMREPLSKLLDVTYHDITALTRNLRISPARLAASSKAMGQEYSWHKTGRWSRAVQTQMERSGWLSPEHPTVFYQTLAAPVLDDRFRYVIYTDRVGREGALEHESFRSTWGPGWVEREEEFLRRATAVLVMGPSTERALVDLYGLAPAQVKVVGAGPGTEIGPIQDVQREPRQLLFIGTNWKLKGGPDLLEAFAAVSERHADWELVLAGSEPDRALPPRTRSLGRVPAAAMPGLFAESALFVVPTYMEALGYSLLESAMHGLPSIGSTVGNQGWVIGDAGRTVEPGDVAGIADAIESVMADYPAYKERAVRRATYLREHMSWDRVAGAIADTLFDESRGDRGGHPG